MLTFISRETISLRIIIDIKLTVNFISEWCIKRYQILIKKKKLSNSVIMMNEIKTVTVTY